MGRNKQKRKRTPGELIRSIVLILAICVFLFSGTQLLKIFLEYKAGTDEYDRIREFVRKTEEKPETEEVTGQEEHSEEKKEETEEMPTPPQIDWVSLIELNEDIIGWIQIDGTDISYPVVKGRDNSFYLKHTFEKNANIAGTIFIDYANSSDFQDCNTLIYGHNMKNGSMFGKLGKYFKDEEALPGRYIWICTPEKDYRYEIFSSHVVDASGDTYTLFPEHNEQFGAYLDKMTKQSYIDFGTSVTKEDKIITLSTCTGNNATRFIVQAKCIAEY